MAGYSSRTLVEKLGMKPGMTIILLDAPAGYEKTLGQLPAGVVIKTTLQGKVPFIQFFVTNRKELEQQLSVIVNHLELTGMVWISWPKKSSPVASDLTENIIRDVGLPLRIVDVKVCAIDEDWSGLKFVWRKENR